MNPAEPAPASRVLRLSTAVVEPPYRFDYWCGAVTEALFSMSTSSPHAADFNCSLEVAPLDALAIVLANGSGQSSYRTRKTLANDADRSFHLMADFRSAWRLDWRGTSVALGPGDLIFTDTRFLHSGHYPDDCAVTNIKIPPAWATAWLRDPERLAGRRIARGSGWGTALSAFVAQLTPEFAAASPLPAKLIAENLGALLALVEAELRGLPPTHQLKDQQTRERVTDAIRQRANEPGLTAADIAASTGIPERSLHRSLAAAGETFAALLLHHRIELARRMLEAAHFGRLTTGEIGRRAGFADPSYFVRAATRHLGATPGRYRAERRA